MIIRSDVSFLTIRTKYWTSINLTGIFSLYNKKLKNLCLFGEKLVSEEKLSLVERSENDVAT